ncbi:MAG: hydroxyacid dehydrogenase [Ardenticatenaceae bacterium]|nr:hydroxyacid dehydrogenase [Ardenticatenaceae bacterium]MCB9445261.1 hydroxyacid dehydrogenase [Ardenticatenaceae bacterium]
MTLHAHLTYPPDDETLTYFRNQLDDGIEITIGDDVPETAVILVAGRPTKEQLEASPNLRALIVPWAGIPEPTRELMADFPHIAVHNLHHNAAPVAETVLTLLLAAAKFTVPFDQSLRNHDWSIRYKRPSPSVLLAGKTALILGYGAIGQRVAHLCRALEMDVLAVRRHASQTSDEFAQEIHPLEALPDLLPRAHALIISLPHTPETDGLIGRDELMGLKRPSLLVNVGRGPIVQQQALYEALRDGILHAAGLDVWYNYPADKPSRSHTPPADFPFHELDNVVISPHRGGLTSETEQLRMAHTAVLLNAAARSEPMPNRVDLQRGY